MSSISVITPSYNQGKFIERTIKSVLGQSVNPLEYIIYDGGSHDDTLEVLRQYEGQVRWTSEPDHGQSHAVNKGIAVSTGEIIAWINSDDVYFPGAFAKVENFFTEHYDVDVLFGDAYYIDSDDVRIKPYDTEAWDPERLKQVCYLCQPAVFFRRQVVERFGYLDESLQFCMDYEFWLRLAKSGAVFFHMSEPLAGSRIYPENKTFSNLVAVHKEINDMLARALNMVPLIWIYRYTYNVLAGRNIKRGTFKYIVLLPVYLFVFALRWNLRLFKRFGL